MGRDPRRGGVLSSSVADGDALVREALADLGPDAIAGDQQAAIDSRLAVVDTAIRESGGTADEGSEAKGSGLAAMAASRQAPTGTPVSSMSWRRTVEASALSLH